MRPTLPLILCTGLLAGCGGGRALSPGSTEGVDPALPPPQRALIPTVDIAPATGWPQGAAPTPARGLVVSRFAGGLEHPRWLHVLPNGDVLVAESNAPAGKSGVDGIKGKVMGVVMKRAGAGVPSAERISVLRDADGDGIAEVRQPFLTGLHSPFGMALVGDTLYIANADALVSVPYRTGQLRIDAVPAEVVDLPGKGDELNHHWTKSLLASRDGARLYVGVGSNSNVAENGMAVEANRAAVLEVDPATRRVRVFASGLRNPVGLALEPQGGALWAVVNERDELGNDLVPDYLAEVREGGFYGWPYSYYGQHLDPRVEPQAPALVARAIKPDYALGSHVAPLGLAFTPGGAWSGGQGGAVIGLHGSWNRKPQVGYKVVFVPFAGGRPAGKMQDLLTGFLDAGGNARGRPVGIAVQADGGILVADDVGNTVWRLAAARD
ncbi:MAG TPA: sorbosone dehydrogenase family protein [Thermomonas sp.]|jgi:glucose/arabinose dehydrogenase|nr:sorbosone dehydrogenase family protein [Thermomonas sp.]HPM55638.1 sorbosone dehydrogenase family protein [Thermomonas sp.]